MIHMDQNEGAYEMSYILLKDVTFTVLDIGLILLVAVLVSVLVVKK